MPGGRSSFSPRDGALLVLLAMLWGNSFLFIKIALAEVAPTWIVVFRMTLGGGLLVALAATLRQGLAGGLGALAWLVLIGIVGGAAPWALHSWAQRFLDSGLAAVLNATTPIATLGLSVLAGHERLHRRRVSGLLVAISGTVVVIGGEIDAGGSTAALAAAVVATVGYALGGVLTRTHVTGRVSAIPAAAAQLVGGALSLAPIAWSVAGPPPSSVAPRVLGALCALGVLGTGLAFVIYFLLIQRVGATNTSMVTYLIPVVGLTSGAVFRGERFGVTVYAGALLLVAGVWLAQREPT